MTYQLQYFRKLKQLILFLFIPIFSIGITVFFFEGLTFQKEVWSFSSDDYFLPETLQIGQSVTRAIELNGICEYPGNWDFEAQDLDCWSQKKNSKAPQPTVVPPLADDGNGSPFDSFSLRLGKKQKDKSPLGKNGYVAAYRSFYVPQIGNPRLEFEYRMYSYDIIASSSYPYDTFEVAINKLTSVVWETGNTKHQGKGCLSKIWKSKPDPNLPYSASKTSIDLSSFKGQNIKVFFVLHNKTDDKCNSWVYIDNIKLNPEMTISKWSNPSGPVYEDDVITYTISYANTGLIAQNNIVITDRIPEGTEFITTSLYNAGYDQGNDLITNTIPSLPIRESGVISFQVRVPLLPPTPPDAGPPPPLTITPIFSDPITAPVSLAIAQPVQPYPVICHSTIFWMAGISDQSNPMIPFTISVAIPPGSHPSNLWVIGKNPATLSLVDETVPPPPTPFAGLGALLWQMPLTEAMLVDGLLKLQTNTPDRLSAILLYEGAASPFSVANLDHSLAYTESYTYSLQAEFPNVPVEVELPIIDVRFWDLGSDPDVDTRVTTVTVQINDNQDSVAFMHPNPGIGNGLRLESFAFNDLPAGVHTLYINVDTEDSLYFLSPHICRSPFVSNTAYLCSDQVGCLSTTAVNNGRGIYLPIILKSSS